MREHPISFKPDLVRAFLFGEKSQTRRVAKPPRGFEHHNIPEIGMPHAFYPWAIWWHGSETDRVGCLQECPYGKPGDRLWVKESLRGDGQPGNRRVGIVRYAADGEMVLPCTTCGIVTCTCDGGPSSRWDQVWDWKRPVLNAMYCPRWASRLLLEITEVRAQWLHDITEEDAKAEGVKPWEFNPDQPLTSGERAGDSPYRSSFAYKWDCINEDREGGKYLWKNNPAVWALTLKQVFE